MTKKELRAEAKRRILSCHPERNEVKSKDLDKVVTRCFDYASGNVADGSLRLQHDIHETILNLPEYKAADILLSYIATENEADPIEITKSALKEGKKAAVPKVAGDKMDFYFLSPNRPIEAQLKTGAFGIQEPTSEVKFNPNNATSKEKIFVITPGLAFSKSGKRCGRGKGYYDRYFSKLKSAGVDFFAVGFCYPCQIFNDEEIETDENDFLMNFILT